VVQPAAFSISLHRSKGRKGLSDRCAFFASYVRHPPL
jgi:hypothetical protein